METLERERVEHQNGNVDSVTGFGEVSQVVLAWPLEWRVALMHQIADSFRSSSETRERKKGTLQEIMARPSTGLPAPTDAEVEQWLAERYSANSNGQAERPRRKRGTLNEALGRMKTSRPAPTDEEVEQMLEQHRMEKYG